QRESLMRSRPVAWCWSQQHELGERAPAGRQVRHGAEYAEQRIRLSRGSGCVQLAVLEGSQRQVGTKTELQCRRDQLFVEPEARRIPSTGCRRLDWSQLRLRVGRTHLGCNALLLAPRPGAHQEPPGLRVTHDLEPDRPIINR